MVVANMHLICGNCGCGDKRMLSWSMLEQEGDDLFGNKIRVPTISCKNCATLHVLDNYIEHRLDLPAIPKEERKYHPGGEYLWHIYYGPELNGSVRGQTFRDIHTYLRNRSTPVFTRYFYEFILSNFIRLFDEALPGLSKTELLEFAHDKDNRNRFRYFFEIFLNGWPEIDKYLPREQIDGSLFLSTLEKDFKEGRSTCSIFKHYLK